MSLEIIPTDCKSKFNTSANFIFSLIRFKTLKVEVHWFEFNLHVRRHQPLHNPNIPLILLISPTNYYCQIKAKTPNTNKSIGMIQQLFPLLILLTETITRGIPMREFFSMIHRKRIFLLFFSGDANEITLKDLKPATEYHLK